MTRSYFQKCQYEQLSNIRRWQIHAGSNHFCFNGHCVTGRSLSGAVIVLCLMSLTSIIWFIFELPILMKESNRNTYSISILVIGLLLIIYTYSKRKKLAKNKNTNNRIFLFSSLFFSIYVYGSRHNTASYIFRTFDNKEKLEFKQYCTSLFK